MAWQPGLIHPEDNRIEVNGQYLNYREWVPAASGVVSPAFLLVHGLASSLRIWDLVANELVKLTGSRVVALDQRGHGRSDKPDDGYENAQIVADDYAFVSRLPLAKPVLIGHSWGATVVLAYAAAHPEEVSSVVLVDGGMGNMWARGGLDNWDEVARRLAPPDFAGTTRSKFLDFYRQGGQGRYLGTVWNDTLEDMVLNIVEWRSDDTVGPRLSRENHMKILHSLWQADNYFFAEQVRCPVLLISAETGQPEAAEWSQAKRAGAAAMVELIQKNGVAVEFVAMPDTIHDIPLQRPARLAELVVEFGRKAGVIK